MQFADIHIHVLPGVDDGAQTIGDMQNMIEGCYESGTRIMCCTPHYHPGYFGQNKEKIQSSFRLIKEYSGKHYPDMQIFLGNELRYDPAGTSWLMNGSCLPLNHTQYVLVDFMQSAAEREITTALNELMNAGWKPVLAHVERYSSLHGKLDVIQGYRDNGIVMQADTQSLFLGFGFKVKRQCVKLLLNRMIDIISSDAHNCTTRPPEMDQCYNALKRKCGEQYTDQLFYHNACAILSGKRIERI